MSLPVLPDVDELVTSALREGMPDASVRVLWPQNWRDLLPLVVARRTGGEATDPRGLDSAVMDVQCAAPARAPASALARAARVALLTACRSQYRGASGYLSHGSDVSGPFELRTGDVPPAPDFFVFQATYRVTARPHLND